jgi:hypothetical protein
MLIKQETVIEELAKAGISPKGVLHVGAHECEELPFYQRLGIMTDHMVWIDAIQSKVQQSKDKGIPNVFQAVITDKDDAIVTFKVTNNVQSSSILEFGTHAAHHPWVHFVSQSEEKTVTLDTFFQRQQLDPSRYDFWNFDIQGAEMLALKGATGALKYAKALYLEVNTEEVYKGCAKLEELDAFLMNLGFKRVVTDITPHGWGDALYVRVNTYPKLSLCIPTMNRYSFLKTNLPQYLANPYIDEIVISDETGEDAEQIKRDFTDPKLKVFVNKKRLGAFLNKEQVVRYASNEWVALIDSDNFAPISYFEAWRAYYQANPLQATTIYAPSRTIPNSNHAGFDYRHFIGKELTKTTYPLLCATLDAQQNRWLETILNTGNYIVNAAIYLASSDPAYSDLYQSTNAWEAKLRTWLLLNKGATFVFPPGFEYYHVAHDGSLYTTTCNEISRYNSKITNMYASFR